MLAECVIPVKSKQECLLEGGLLRALYEVVASSGKWLGCIVSLLLSFTIAYSHIHGGRFLNPNACATKGFRRVPGQHDCTSAPIAMEDLENVHSRRRKMCFLLCVIIAQCLTLWTTPARVPAQCKAWYSRLWKV